jgi:hypothetical protein
MQRRRTFAGSPARPCDELWQAMASLIEDTLGRSSGVDLAAVKTALAQCAPAVRLLAAGSYLDSDPIVLIAPPVHLSLFTVTGTSALTVDEDTGPVPGGTQVTTWTLHVPAPTHLADAINAVIAGNPHLSTKPAPGESKESQAAALIGTSIDHGALATRLNDAGGG